MICQARVQSDSGHFAGGSLSYVFTNETNIRVRSLLAWDLGYGSCGPGCNRSMVGQSSTIRRSKVLDTLGSDSLGVWSMERKNPTPDLILHFVNDRFEGQIAEVNEHLGWYLEAGWFYLNLDPNTKEQDIKLDGDYWKKINTIQTKDHDVDKARYHLQITVSAGKRSDTGKPNNGPLALFKPLYSILLEDVTEIQLVTTDPDGDVVRCALAKFVRKGELEQMNNVEVDLKTCIIRINASVSAGYTDGGTVVILVTVSDLNVNSISVNGDPKPTYIPLSSIPVQFLVRTVTVLKDPSFVAPTPDDKTKFEMYAGGQLQIKLFASPHPSSKARIESISVMCVERMGLPMTPLARDPTREHVSTTVLTWNTTSQDIGTFIFQAVPIDSNGTDGRERNFIVIIKDLDLKKSEQATTDDLHPLQGNFSCLQNSTCIVPVMFSKGQDIKNVEFVNSTSPGVDVSSLGRDGDMYKTQFTMPATNPGQQNVCLRISGPSSSVVTCVNLTVIIPDPCRNQPCGNSGICSSHLGTFQCSCRVGFTGKYCETEINFCESKPCLNDGRCFNYPTLPLHFICKCKPPWNGDTCDIGPPTTHFSTSKVITTEEATSRTEEIITSSTESSTTNTESSTSKTHTQTTTISEEPTTTKSEPVTSIMKTPITSVKLKTSSTEREIISNDKSSTASEHSRSTTTETVTTITDESTTNTKEPETTNALTSSTGKSSTTSKEPTTSAKQTAITAIEKSLTTSEDSASTTKEAVTTITDESTTNSKVPETTDALTSSTGKSSTTSKEPTTSAKQTTITATDKSSTTSEDSSSTTATITDESTTTSEVRETTTSTGKSSTTLKQPTTSATETSITSNDKSSTSSEESTKTTTETVTTITDESTTNSEEPETTDALKPKSDTPLTSEDVKALASTDSAATSPGSTTASSSLSSPSAGSCISAPRHKVEQAAVKKKLRCSCTHPQTKKTVHIVTPVATTKELAVATGAGFGAGSVVILFSGLVYVLVQKYKARQKGRNLGSPQSIPHSRPGSQDYSDSPNYYLEEKEAPSSHPNIDEF